MVQIKLSVAFILATAAIAPVVALPVYTDVSQQTGSVLNGMVDDYFSHRMM